MFEDPIVNEVRKAGEKIQKECGNDINIFIEMIKQTEKKLKQEGRTFISKDDFVKTP